MKALITFCHPDTESGTTIMDDGTKAYWTSGYSVVNIVKPDGGIESVHFGGKYSLESPVIAALRADDAQTNSRPMTTAEEIEWSLAHCGSRYLYNEYLSIDDGVSPR